jgi:hypothetical protein
MLNLSNIAVREWFERFEFYTLANNLETVPAQDASEAVKAAAVQKNLAIFIARLDADVYKLLKSLCSPDAITTKADVKKLLVDHLAPKSTKFAQRYRFHKIVQSEGQSASLFIAELRARGADCEFTNFDEAMLDRLLVGLRDEKLVSGHWATSSGQSHATRCDKGDPRNGAGQE